MQIRGALARTKEEMNDAGALKEDAYNADYGRTTSASTGRRELFAKQKVEEGKVAGRLKATKDAKVDMPRLEQLARHQKKLLIQVTS